MAISGKDVRVWMWRMIKFSTRCAYTLIKNHPFVSCPLIFFLGLYICFPSFFWISLYSSVFIILAFSVTKVYLRHRNARSSKGGEENSGAESIRKDDFAKNDAPNNRNEKRFGRARSVRRRRPRGTSRDSSVHTSEDEKSTVLSTFNNDMVEKSALAEERPKEIKEVAVDSVISNADCSSADVSSGLRPELHHVFSGRSRKFGGGGGDMETESSEGTDEEDEHDREANNKAVQWTETDQKNLMDLGLSEIERNKRLESLIARRRARKMLSLQLRRPAMKLDNLEAPGIMASLTIPRSNSSFHAGQSAGYFSPMPGSAPSVLVPNYNPFDLPYDAQEEKPILTGGSFQLEFKDMTFIKPENVGAAASIAGELKEDQREISLSHDSTKNEGFLEGLQKSKANGQLDEKDRAKIVDVESGQSLKPRLNTITANIVVKEEIPDSKLEAFMVGNGKEENSSEVQSKSVMMEDSMDKFSCASSSEDDVPPIYKVDKDAVLRSLASPLLRNLSMNGQRSSQMGHVGDNYDPSIFDKNRMHEQFFHAGARITSHTPMSSIASDLQVEVSEVSSPGLTDDGSSLFPDEEFSAEKEDVENESTTGNEDIREKSSELPQIDENKSEELYNTNEGNTVEVGCSRTNVSENDVPHELAKPVTGNDPTGSLSQSGLKDEWSKRIEDHSSSFYSNIKDNFQLSTSSDLSHMLASDSLAFPVTDRVQPLKGDPMVSILQNDVSEKAEQRPSYPSLVSKGELSTICKVLQDNDEKFNIRVSDDIADPLIEEGRREPAKLSDTSNPNSIDFTRTQPEKIEGHHSVLELVGKNVNAIVSEDVEGDSKDAKQNKMEDSMAIHNNDTPESIPVDGGEQHRAELRSSGVHPQSRDHQVQVLMPDEGEHRPELRSSVHPNLSDHQVQALLPELVLGQSHFTLCTSSPRSVLQPNISVDPSSLSSFSDATNIEIHRFQPQIVEDSMFGEARVEGLTSPPRTMLLMVDSNSHSLHDKSAETLKESSNCPTSAKEANSSESVREDTVHIYGNKQNNINYIPEGSSEGQESTNLSKSTEAANSTGSVSQDRVHKDEKIQDGTDRALGSSGRQISSNLSLSTEEENTTGSVSEDTVTENEWGQDKTKCTPEGSSGRQESSNPLRSTREDNEVGSLSEDMVQENERRQSKTNDIPEGSSKGRETSNLICTEQDNSLGAMSQELIHGKEVRPNEMTFSPECSSEKFSPDSAAGLSKLPEEINPDLTNAGQESSDLLTSTKDANNIGSAIKPEDEKKQSESKDIPEVSSNSFSNYDSEATLSKAIDESSSYRPILTPDQETNSIGTVSEQVIPEGERRQNETKDISEGRLERLSPEPTVALSKGIAEFSANLPHTVQESVNPSASPEEANSLIFSSECIIHDNENTRNEANDIPGGSSPGLSSPDATTVISENTGRISSRSLTMTDGSCDELHSNEVLPAFRNPIAQGNTLSGPIINMEEGSKVQESTNATSARNTQGTVNELQKLGAREDHTGLSHSLETSNVSQDESVSMSADEKKEGFSKNFEEESKTSSPKEISGVEPSKSSGENNIQNNDIPSPESENTTNASAGSSFEEEVNGNQNTEKTVDSQGDETSKEEIVEEASNV